MAAGKELHYFDSRFEKGLDWYESQFRDADQARAVGEATPSYMYEAVAVSRIADALPTVRMVAILRNPVDRTYSDYLMLVTRGREQRVFEEAIEGEMNDAKPTTSYIDRSRYLYQLERLAEHLPDAALHVMITEQLALEPRQTYQDLCRFLEIDATALPSDLGRRVNQYTEFRSLALRRSIKHRKPGLIRRALEAANVKRRAAYRALEPATAANLKSIFDSEVRALSEYLGRDLSKWWW